jgi:hypothetical protein
VALISAVCAIGACNAVTGAGDLRLDDDESGSSASSSSGNGAVGAGGAGAGAGGAGTGAGINTQDLLPSDAVSITSIDLYQGVRRPLMANGAAASSNVPIVAQREALMRIGYTATTTTTVTAVVTIGANNPILVQATVGGSSTTSDLNSTINVTIPPDQMAPGASYSVELLESPELTTGTNPASTYPAEGQEAMQVTDVGTLKVVLIPIAYGADGSNRVPNPQAGNYRSKFESLYPVADVEIQVAGTFQWNSSVSANGSGWGSLLDAIANYRQQAGAAYNEHYYGIFMPTASFSSYCQGGCVAGLSYLADAPGDAWARAGIGVGFPGGGSTDTAAHEVGHQNGREHAPCQVNDADPFYPHSGGTIGEWGYDLVRGELINPSTSDFMGYCNPTWVSDYTYRALFDRLTAINGSASWHFEPWQLDRTYERIRIDVDGVTWTEPITLHTPPMGRVETVTITDDQGDVDVTGRFYPYSHIPGGVLLFEQGQRDIHAAAFEIEGLRHVVERPTAVLH